MEYFLNTAGLTKNFMLTGWFPKPAAKLSFDLQGPVFYSIGRRVRRSEEDKEGNTTFGPSTDADVQYCK
jgi:hypothetical protein